MRTRRAERRDVSESKAEADLRLPRVPKVLGIEWRYSHWHDLARA